MIFMKRSSAAAEQPPYKCPCCKFKTLRELAANLICPVCFWEDDGQGGDDADVVRGGPNGDLSLRMAQENFAKFGAVEARHAGKVRRPERDER